MRAIELDYGSDYPYLKDCQRAQGRPWYQLWWFTRTYLEIVRPLALPQGSKILSIGAGMCQYENFLAKPFGYDVVALDFNLPSLKAAKPLPFSGQEVKMVAADAQKLPFKDSSFDLCFSMFFMEHCTSVEGLKSAFGEMERVLKKDGKMFHEITVLGEDGIHKDRTHHIKWEAQDWQNWFVKQGWNTFKPIEHKIPLWSRKKIGLIEIKGAFYLQKNSHT